MCLTVPCLHRLWQVIDYSTSKTGKHGHAKAKIVALDIFTQRKYEDICPTSHNMVAPVGTWIELILVPIQTLALTVIGDKWSDESSLAPVDLMFHLAKFFILIIIITSIIFILFYFNLIFLFFCPFTFVVHSHARGVVHPRHQR